MNNFYKYLVFFIACFVITVTADAQSAVRYNNSLRLQYGLYQYNTNQRNFINENNENLLSIGLTYRHQLGAVSGLNFTGRYYQWALNNNQDLETYAAQAMWVFHLKRVSRGWQLNRFTPYAGFGVGVENHNIKKASAKDSSFTKLYVPLEAGILYNISSRFSIGVFAEYKISTAPDIKKLVNAPKGKRDIVNTAGISVAWHFGKKESNITVPVITSNPYISDRYYNNRQDMYSKIDEKVEAVDLRDQHPVAKVPFPEIPEVNELNDTIYEEPAINIDSIEVNDSLLITNKDSVVVTKNDSQKNINDSVKTKDMVAATSLAPIDSVNKRDTVYVRDSSLAQNKMAVDTAQQQMQREAVKNKMDTAAVANKSGSVDSAVSKKKVNQQKDSVIVKNRVLIQEEPLADSLLQALNKEREYAVNRDRKLDSLSRIIVQLNNRMDRLANSPSISERQKERVVIQQVPIDYTDEPAVKRLKESYNDVGVMIDENYQRGYINEMEVERLRREANEINNTIERLSDRDYDNYENLEDINRRIASMQFQVSRYNDEAIKMNRNDYNDRDINSLHYKLDRTLMELDDLKRSRVNVPENADTSEIQNLIRMQQQLQDKLNQVEKQNLQLKNEIEQIGEKAPPAPVVKEKEENNILYTVLFSINSDAVNASDKDILLQKVTGLQMKEGDMILLSGFADKSGNAAYNLKLSQRRVQAVKAELIKHGFKKENIVERYFGSEKATESKNDNDRKVVVRIINN